MLHVADIRHALRRLRRSPGFTLLTVLVLAGGLGLSTFTFSFLYTAMIRPLPLADGERIARLTLMEDGRPQRVDAVDVPMLRAGLSTVETLGAYTGHEVVVGRDGDRHVLDATVTDAALFTIAQVRALLGRTLVPSDAEPGAEPVVVLSHRTWTMDFGGDSAVVNRPVALNGATTRVVGVMPERFEFPVATDAWMPRTDVVPSSAGLESVQLVARLAPDVPHEQAAAQATLLLDRTLRARDPAPVSTGRRSARSVLVESFPAAQFGEERALVFTVLNTLAALILLLALVNVTNLLLARANERVRETAVRLALGAPTGRLIMQGMWETIILCVVGGIVGTAGAAWGLAAITRWTRANLEGNLAFWWVWQMDGVTLLSAGVFVTVAIAVLGAVLSLRTARMNVREIMQDGSARAGSKREGRLSRRLVATQVTTVTVLMFFSVLGGDVARRLVTLDPGFDTARLLQGGIEPPAARYATHDARAAVLRNVHARLDEQDAFTGVMLRGTLADHDSDAGRIATRDTRAMGTLPTAHVRATLGDLSTIGISVVAGRAFDSSDERGRSAVAVISRSFANRMWPGRSAVGEELRLAGLGDSLQFRTIVGVVSDVPYGNPLARDRSSDAVYVPLQQVDAGSATFVVRYRTSELDGRQALFTAFAAVDPLLVPDQVQPVDESLRKLALITVSVTKLFGACFAFALLLALVGTYGLMSRSIGNRTREIGVRRALGASDALITRLLLRQGGRQLGTGSLIAAPVMVAMALTLRHYFPISGWLAATAGVLVSVSIVGLVLATSLVPTRRVLRMGLTDALRDE
ncbi:MAG: ABC transporter permease [Gemmatimonadota bacterium]